MGAAEPGDLLQSSQIIALDFSAELNRLKDGYFDCRKWVFEEIDRWMEDESGPAIFLLTAEPGAGKSTLAARLVQTRSDVITYHFCIRGINQTIVPATILRSLAAQLVDRLPGYGQALANTIMPTHLTVSDSMNIENMTGGQVTGVVIKSLTALDPQTELEVLLRGPLAKIEPRPEKPLLIVIDSLDEAATLESHPTLVDLLSGMQGMPGWLRFLCTSRPEESMLRCFSGVTLYKLDAESAQNLEDIRSYVTDRLNQPTLQEKIQAAGQTGESIISRLAGTPGSPEQGLATGNFLYARILLDEIEAGRQSLANLEALPRSLDEIYHAYFQRIKSECSRAEWQQLYQPILGILSVALEPLNEKLIAAFTGQRRTAMRQNLGVLRQFLDEYNAEDEPRYRLFHKSLTDYLQDEKRSEDNFCFPEDFDADMVNAYLPKFKENWPSCDDYGLRYLPQHLSRLKDWKQLFELLLDYGWLEAKLERTDIRALLADMDLLLGDTGLPADQHEVVKLLQQALRLSAHVLTADKSQLAGHLLGRMLEQQNPWLQPLLEQAKPGDGLAWLRPVYPCLNPPRSGELRTLSGHTGGVLAVAISPDGQKIVSGSWDNTLKVWDASSGMELRTLSGHEWPVSAIAISQDGQKIVSASADNTLKVWELASGTELFTLSGHSDEVHAVAISPDGQKAVSGSKDHTLKVWDLCRGEELFTLSEDTDIVLAVAISPDGERVVSMALDGKIKVWNLDSGEVLNTLSWDSERVGAVNISPDGKKAIAGLGWFADTVIKVWDLDSGTVLHTLRGHIRDAIAVAISPDGRLAASGAQDQTIRVWDLNKGAEICTLRGHSADVEAVAFSPDGQKIVSGADDNTLKVWDLAGGVKPPALRGHPNSVNSIAISQDGRLAISGSGSPSTEENPLKVWDLASGRELFALSGHSRTVQSVAISPDGKKAVSASWDRTVKVWDLERGKKLRTLRGPDTFEGVAISPDGKKIISTGGDTLKVWDLSSGKKLRSLRGHTKGIHAVAISLDGKKAVSSGTGLLEGINDFTIRVWDLDSGDELRTLRGHTREVPAVAISPDGREILSGSEDGTLKVWDLDSGEERCTLSEFNSVVYAVAFSPDGRLVVSGSGDKALRVWDAARWTRIATFYCNGDVHACAFTPDGRMVVAGDAGGGLYFLRLEGF